MISTLKIVPVALILVALGCSDGSASGQASNESAPSVVAGSSGTLALSGRVTDAAHLLTSAQTRALTSKLEALEHSTKHQMVVVTVTSLGGRDVANFTKDLANRWDIGRKGYNDGVVLLVAPNERKVRIAVGYGLERTLTNRMCQKIISDVMLPHFKNGDLSGGILAGTDALIAHLS